MKFEEGKIELGPIKDSDSTGMKISKILFADFKMEGGDPVEVTKAACTVADVLGCVVSLLKPQFKPADFAALREGLIKRIDLSMEDIVEHGMALRESRDAKKH